MPSPRPSRCRPCRLAASSRTSGARRCSISTITCARRPADNLAHLDGAGIAKANLLTRATAAEQVGALQAAAPGRFTWFASADIARPENIEALTQAVKSGARGFGEMKLHLATDSPEFHRAYALAAELNVPILIHFQEVDHFPERRHVELGLCRRSSSPS